ncbi:ATP-binding cassette domain-containing protein [Nocardia sp. NPDC005745]|uniref:ATP-binding cassette domain-containing protein n=1 Tax=Nocardia sp. NPDC005745 TaxID=3157061 RepID=UPI0033E6C986
MTLTAAAVPSTDTVTDTVLSVRNLRVGFPGSAGDVVEGVGFDLRRGEILAIVGESGSGKSVTTRSLVGLAGAAPGCGPTGSSCSAPRPSD